MSWRFPFGLAGLLYFTSAAALTGDKHPGELKDIFFGEILYYAYQDKYFEAISKLDTELGQFYALDEPDLDPFSAHLGLAEFSVGDLELSYRMHKKAGRAIKAILDSNVDQTTRNEAAYRLARIHYTKQQATNALHALELIKGKVPDSVRARELFLRAQVYVTTGRFPEAIEILKTLRGNRNYSGFVEYNLGMALIQDGQEEQGIIELSKFGQIITTQSAVLALKDKANLMLGSRMLEAGQHTQARQYFERVRLKGPFSNRVLLGAGWVEASAENYERALVPWTLLQGRETTDASVQESMLAVPFAYSRLNVHSQAAVMYGKALDVFGTQIDRLNDSIKSIRQGKFLTALLREEADKDKNWIVNLRELSDAPETFYILDLMASHDFQEFLRNYRDMSELHKQNARWLKSLDVYEEMIEIRRAYYEPLLPVIGKQFQKLDSRMRLRLEQRNRLDGRLKSLLVARRPEYLAYVDEREVFSDLDRMTSYLATNPQHASQDMNDRVRRLRGVVNWQIFTEYDERLTQAYDHLHELDEIIDELNHVYKSFIRTRQAATQSYEGYSLPISRSRTKLNAAQVKLKRLMARQGRMLENMAVYELEKRREKLEGYQIKARFALADSYDRASKKQEAAKVALELKKIEAQKIKIKVQKEEKLEIKSKIKTAPEAVGSQ